MLRKNLIALGLTASLAASAALAQAGPGATLAGYAPASSLLSFSMETDQGVPEQLAAALAALPWDEAGQVLLKTLGVFGDEADLGDLLPFAGSAQDLLQEALEERCAPAAAALAGTEVGELVDGLLLTLSMTAFAPIPQVLLLAHSPRPDTMARLHDGLAACWGGDLLDQDGVQLTVLADGSDMPLVVAQVDAISIIATDPNLVRAAVRLARGSSEGSLAGAPLGQALGTLTPGGIKLGVDFAAIADVVTGLTGPLPAEQRLVAERALRALRTFGTSAFSLGWSEDGLLLEHVLSPDPTADPALAALFLDGPVVRAPVWTPVDAVALGSYGFPLHAFIDYLDGWLADLEGLIGWRTDVRSLSADALGLDLDAALLDWLGDSYQLVQLDALGTDLVPWVQGPGTVVFLPVRDEEAARNGLDLLGTTIQELYQRLGSFSGAMGGFSSSPGGLGANPADAFLDALFGQNVALTQSTVRDVTVDRVRIGWGLDLGVAVVDGHLLVGSPARALNDVLAVRAGALAEITALPDWREALAQVHPQPRSLSVSDVAANLHGLADLGDLFTQPLAALVSMALVESQSRPSYPGFGGFSDPFGDPMDDLWPFTGDWMTEESWDPGRLQGLDLASMVIGNVEWNDSYDAVLTSDSSYLVLLTPPGQGQVVEVELLDLSGGWVDTYLYVADEQGLVLFHNDDGPNTRRSYVAFEAEPGRSYQLVISSFSGFSEGLVTLNVSERSSRLAETVQVPEPEPWQEPADEPLAAEAVAAQLPTFAELLMAAEILPKALHVVADHSGLAVGQSWVEDGRLRGRYLWPLR